MQNGDLLITTGLDGIFPAGLLVARVSKVHDLEEGAYSYRIEAKPTCLMLSELQVVFVLPPISQETKEKSSAFLK